MVAYRARYNGIGGLIEDAPLGASATTLASAALAALPVITSGVSYIAITLDPDGVAGAPEIVWLTAHSASATTATIARGKENTTARAHNQDIRWVHGPTARDYPELVYTVYSKSADYTTSSSTYADIDATNIPALSLDLIIGDVVLCTMRTAVFNTGAGEAILFDWDIDQPTSANTNFRTLNSGTDGAAVLAASGSSELLSPVVEATFIATEAGIHTFKPQWRRGNSGTVTIPGTSASWSAPIVHSIERKTTVL